MDSIFEIFRKTLFFVLIGLLFVNLLLSPNPLARIYPSKTVDEKVWTNTSLALENGGIHSLISMKDDKPLPFLFLEAILGQAHTIVYTRIFNIIIILLISVLIYKITNNKLSFLFPILPITFSSTWLNSSNVELIFIVLGILYKKKQGIFVGIATLFRPYALIFTPLLKRAQIKSVLAIGLSYTIILFLLGGFFIYLDTVSSYPNYDMSFGYGFYLKGLIFLVLFAIVGTKNKELFIWGIFASFIILIRPHFGTYYLTASTLFFISSLTTEKEK